MSVMMHNICIYKQRAMLFSTRHHPIVQVGWQEFPVHCHTINMWGGRIPINRQRDLGFCPYHVKKYQKRKLGEERRQVSSILTSKTIKNSSQINFQFGFQPQILPVRWSHMLEAQFVAFHRDDDYPLVHWHFVIENDQFIVYNIDI